jgi:hypothetical protein
MNDVLLEIRSSIAYPLYMRSPLLFEYVIEDAQLPVTVKPGSKKNILA